MSRPILRLNDGFNHTSPELRDEVKELQTALANKGFTVGADGFFGVDTEDAVKQFQRAQRLVDDGIVGFKTWAALLDIPAPTARVIKNSFPTTIPRNDPAMLKELAEALKYKSIIEAAAASIGMPPSLIAGIGSRESRWGLALKPPGPAGTGDATGRKPKPPLRPGKLPPGGGGFGRGLLQIDFDAHEFAQTGNWKDPEANITFGCQVLKQSLGFIKKKTKQENISLDPQMLLRAALAGYNCGPGNAMQALRTGRDIDFFTAHRDYSKGVLDRAGWYQLQGWE